MIKMNKLAILSILIGCLLPFALFSQETLPLIPKPKKIEMGAGSFNLLSPNLQVSAFEEFMQVSELLKDHPFINFSEVELIKKRKKIPENGVRLILPEEGDKLDKDAYRIEVDSQGILITAWEAPQMINAIMTLVQISYLQESGNLIPALTLEDAPRFAYRGLHLDVSRHFFPISFLEKYIDLMAIYKLNRFHWHLTDGAGWRLEIKKYPELTQKAAWRNFSSWKDWWNSPRQYVEMGTPNAYGGFYTQEEARHLIDYAARKGITVIPEIEMPGHSEEVLAVYPNLSCSGQPYHNSEFCIGNEETFTFLTGVLDEVIDVFPSELIHIGGDEASKESWKTCPKCKKRMEEEGLENVDELQSYLIKRINDYVKSKGRKIIGWDEILEGGLAEGATVMSWRGEEGGIKAANSGHDVIMTPGSPMYFDSYQSNPMDQPEAIGGFTPLSRVYDYDPVPSDINDNNRKHIIGVQANLWTEYMPTQEHVEYMAYPRTLALSEVAWTSPEQKDWADFESRLQKHYMLLQRLNVNYYRPTYKPLIRAVYNDSTQTSRVTISSEQYHPTIRYTIDGSDPTAQSPVYVEPLELLKSTIVKSAVFADSVRLGAIDSLQVDIHRAIGKDVIYNNPWDTYEARGDSTLVNGVKGGLSYGDGEWQGFTKGGVDVTIDFERREELNSVSIRFMQVTGPGVYMPGQVTLEVSDNGKDFREWHTIKNNIPTTRARLTFKEFKFDLKGKMARYIRIKATNPQRGYLFTDEIIVY